MEIVIAGAGRVGFHLAKTLSIIHNVTVIDKNAEALKRLHESLDIMVVHGDIEDPVTYGKIGIEKAELFIAVTDLDEANLISTMIVDERMEIGRKFIRLQNESLIQSKLKERLSISEAIYPLKMTSATVASLLDYPKANNVKHFKYTDFKLVSVRVSQSAPMESLQNELCSVVGVERHKEFFSPEDMESVQVDDLVYFFGAERIIRQMSSKLQTVDPVEIRRCVIFGAGNIGLAVAMGLKERGIEIKLLEKDTVLCERADELLEGTVKTINCKYGTEGLYEEEGLKYADMMIAASGNDEFNIIKCLEARENGIQKVVAIINEIEYYNLMHALGIVVVRGPKMSAYNEIIERIYSSEVVMERKFCGGKANIFLRKIFPNSSLMGKMLRPIKFQGGNTSYLIRDGILQPFRSQIVGQEGDVIVAFCAQTYLSIIKSWIYEL